MLDSFAFGSLFSNEQLTAQRLDRIFWALAGFAILGLTGYWLVRNQLVTSLPGLGLVCLVGTSGLNFWLSFERADYQPGPWRLISRVQWFSRPRYALAIFLAVLATGLFLGGAVGTNGYTSTSLLVVGLVNGLIFAGAGLVGAGLGQLPKLTCRKEFWRRVGALVLVIIGVVAALNYWTTGLTKMTVINGPLQATLLPLIILAVSTLGFGIAVVELIGEYRDREIETLREFWNWRLPSKTLGNFGAGTALYVQALLRHWRGKKLFTTSLLLIITLAMAQWLSEPNFFLFFTLALGVVSYQIGCRAGEQSAKDERAFRWYPVKKRLIVANNIVAAITTQLVTLVVIGGLFGRRLVPVSWQIVLEGTLVGLLLVAYWASWLGQTKAEPQKYSAFGLMIALVLISLFLVFRPVASPLETILGVAVWALGAGLFLGWRYRVTEKDEILSP